MEDHIKTEHESFGVINLSRVSTTGVNLFQSPLRLHNFIAIEISHASVSRNIHQPWVNQEKSIVRIALSEAQFAQFITSAGLGGGTPCTIERLGYQSVPECPMENMRETFTKEFEETTSGIMDTVTALRAELDAIIDQPRLTKGDKEAIKNLTAKIERELTGNLPFIHQQFEEAAEKTVSAAKAEVESYIGMRIKQSGVKNLIEGELPTIGNMGLPEGDSRVIDAESQTE